MKATTVALFLAIAISLGAFGQISLKYGMRQVELGAVELGMTLRVVRAVFTPYVILGLSLYAISSCFWLVVLSKCSYVGVVFLSRIFFHDQVTPVQWVGIVLMVTGLVLVAHYGSATGTAH